MKRNTSANPYSGSSPSRRASEAINLINQGAAFMAKNRLVQAEKCFRQAISLHTAIPEAHNNLGSVLREQGRIDEALACFARAVELRRQYATAHSNWLFARHYTAGIDLRVLRQMHEEWAKQHMPPAAQTSSDPVSALAHKRGANHTSVIGLVSSDLRMHPVGVFIAPWLLNRDRQALRVVAFSAGPEDAFTIRLKQAVDAWHDIRGMNDSAVWEVIQRESVDVLADLSGHTAGNRLLLFGRRAAPVQVSWLGYPSTTGVPAMDALLTDLHTVPEGHESAFTEKVVRLPGLRFCYLTPDYAPPVSALPADRKGFITFGSFNNLAKLTPQVVRAWAAILNAIPDSRLILKWRALSDLEVQQALRQRFASEGLDPSRVELRGWSGHDAMLGEYADVDIALDPFPFSGGLTSCDALYMGVPVLTLQGTIPISRQTASFLRVMGLENWITDSVHDYVLQAVALAAARDRLCALRQRLRATMLTSPLCDGASFANAVDRALLSLATVRSDTLGHIPAHGSQPFSSI